MKTTLQIVLWLALTVWVGAEIFFPIVAAVTFKTLTPDTHTAGAIVGRLLGILHNIGLVSGVVAVIVLAVGPFAGAFNEQRMLAPMVLLVAMMACTAYSQYGITSAMERDRVAAGGAIKTAEPENPLTAHFQKLHVRSTRVEVAVIVMGLLTVVLVAKSSY